MKQDTAIGKAIKELEDLSEIRGNTAEYDNGIEKAISILNTYLPSERVQIEQAYKAAHLEHDNYTEAYLNQQFNNYFTSTYNTPPNSQ